MADGVKQAIIAFLVIFLVGQIVFTVGIVREHYLTTLVMLILLVIGFICQVVDFIVAFFTLQSTEDDPQFAVLRKFLRLGSSLVWIALVRHYVRDLARIRKWQRNVQNNNNSGSADSGQMQTVEDQA